MLKPLHTIWLTGLTLFALLLSSVSASASLNMPLKNRGDSLTVSSLSHDEHLKCLSSQLESITTETDCHDLTNDINPEHQCYPSSCAASALLISQVIITNYQTSQRIPFFRETAEYVNSVTGNLYHPPIV